ncbi:MAG: rhodanese-like domain-containing protein [Rhizobiaceae bacterium]
MSKISVRELVQKANEVIETVDVESAMEAQTSGAGVLVDIRDIRELQRDGTVNGSVHVPRGMLEFWFDEQSPYHKPVLADQSKKYILYCASGWRSALSAKTLLEMGFENVAHIEGGFTALNEFGADISKPESKK